jgi:hypothetical protein
MNESVQYWIPRGLPESLQVALSIPGKASKTVGDHRNRLEALLMTLAEEAEENLGAGELAQWVYQFVPDQTLYLENPTDPQEIVQILMESDHLTRVFLPASSLGPGIKSSVLQVRCKEANLFDRLTNLTQD